MLLQLFFSFFKIGLFSFGGGYAILPMLQQQIVEKHSWMTLSELTDALTIAGMTPGAISVNTATFVGTRLAGVAGGVVATLGCILPSSIIVLLLAILFFKSRNMKVVNDALNGIRPAVVALISAAALTLTDKALFDEAKGSVFADFILYHINIISLLLFLAAVILLLRKKAGVMPVIFGAGVVSLLVFSLYGIFV